MAENKVQFNLKNVKYAILTDGSTPTFGTPAAIPGAVSLSLNPVGDVSKFYADGMVYYQTVANNGYDGNLEIARIPDAMLQAVWGYTIGSSSHVLTESALTEPKPFALLFEIDGDADQQLYAIYNCMAGRPAIASKTIEDSKEVQTATIDITAAPLQNGRVMARTTSTASSTVRSSWFTTVFQES